MLHGIDLANDLTHMTSRAQATKKQNKQVKLRQTKKHLHRKYSTK